MSNKLYRFIIIQVVVLATNALGQVGSQRPSITNGSRVRIKLDSSPSWIIGNIQDVRSDSIYFASDQKTFPIKSISKFELSTGKKLNTGQGGKMGLIIGGIAGAIAFAVISSGEDGFVLTAEEAGAGAAISSVALGGLTGLAVGSLSKTDQWQTIAVQDIVLRFIPEDKLSTSRPIDRKKKIHRWSASAFSGKTNANVGSDIESSFNSNGFENNGFGPSTSGSSSKLFALNYRLNPRLTAGLIHSQTDFGETMGWQRLGSGFSYLGTPITSSANTSAFLLSLNWSHLNAGIGPAIYLISSHALNRGDRKNYKTTKLGAVAQVGLQVPHPYWPVSLEIKFQYHIVGNVEIGPFEFEAGRQSRTFPKTKVDFNHIFMGVGIGFKF